MNKNKTTKRNNRKEANQSKSFQITNDFVCLDVHMNSYDNEDKGVYNVYDEYAMERFLVQRYAVNTLIDAGCVETDAVCLLVLAKKVVNRYDKISNLEIANILCELIEVQGYSSDKLIRVIAGLGESDAKALFNHKRLPATLDRYFMVDGWETNGLLEEAFCEKEEEDDLYN